MHVSSEERGEVVGAEGETARIVMRRKKVSLWVRYDPPTRCAAAAADPAPSCGPLSLFHCTVGSPLVPPSPHLILNHPLHFPVFHLYAYMRL